MNFLSRGPVVRNFGEVAELDDSVILKGLTLYGKINEIVRQGSGETVVAFMPG
jgi:hypothetical protein